MTCDIVRAIFNYFLIEIFPVLNHQASSLNLFLTHLEIVLKLNSAEDILRRYRIFHEFNYGPDDLRILGRESSSVVVSEEFEVVVSQVDVDSISSPQYIRLILEMSLALWCSSEHVDPSFRRSNHEEGLLCHFHRWRKLYLSNASLTRNHT